MAANNRQSNGNHQFEYPSVRRALDHTLLSSKEYHVVIVGASYAGLSAALTLLTLKDGQPLPLRDYGDYSHLYGTTQVKNLRITIIDERDGCCKLISVLLQVFLIPLPLHRGLPGCLGFPLLMFSAQDD